MGIRQPIYVTLQNRRAQLLLPAVLLLPLFVLVIYLLVEVTKVSIAKVRHQFALDNAAYTQMTSVSVFLNATAILNGPLPYRVLKLSDKQLKVVDPDQPYRDYTRWTVFDLFFQAGAVPTIAPDYDKNAVHNPPPKQDSIDWGVGYVKYDGIENETDTDGNPRYDRSEWEKETPAEIKGPVYIMNEELVNRHYVPAEEVAVPAMEEYFTTYVQIGDTFNLQKHLYQSLIKNAHIFREGYFLNVDDCKKGECARQSASRLMSLLSIPTKRQETSEVFVYFSNSAMAGGTGGAVEIPFKMSELDLDPLFLFAYVEPAGRRKLKTLKKGVVLKQNFPLPRNHFNIDLTAKYKPYVRNTLILTCPRANNNCVWPNPLPKYSVILRP